MTINDINNYAYHKNIIISPNEASFIYNFIKNNYNEILDGNDKKIYDLQNYLRYDLYKKIIELYENNKSIYLK